MRRARYAAPPMPHFRRRICRRRLLGCLWKGCRKSCASQARKSCASRRRAPNRPAASPTGSLATGEASAQQDGPAAPTWMSDLERPACCFMNKRRAVGFLHQLRHQRHRASCCARGERTQRAARAKTVSTPLVSWAAGFPARAVLGRHIRAHQIPCCGSRHRIRTPSRRRSCMDRPLQRVRAKPLAPP